MDILIQVVLDEVLKVLEVPMWCWGCWSVDHTLSSKALHDNEQWQWDQKEGLDQNDIKGTTGLADQVARGSHSSLT